MRKLGHYSQELGEFFGLLVECPLHGGNPLGCLFCEVRGMQLQDRFSWAKELNMDEASVLRSRCAQCMAEGTATGRLPEMLNVPKSA